MNHKNDLPPPVEVNLDPYAECNNRCYFCIGQRYLREHREEVKGMRILPLDYMRRLVHFISKWGVRGLCISGGGEPSLHPDIADVIGCARYEGMDVSFVTNMVSISDKLNHNLTLCRWVAMSVNASNPETYTKVMGVNHFESVIKNIENLVEARKDSNVDLCFKYLLLPENIDGIYDACKLAKELGIQDFHVRPVDLERGDIKGHHKIQLDRAWIEDQFLRCHELEDDSFHVYTITHKFDDNFHNKLPFDNCLATPLLLPILTDGNGYVCVDVKMMEKYKLGSAYPDPETIMDWWGSDKHRDILKNIKPHVDCCDRRCTFGQYNKQMEEVVENDRMCLSFP